MLTKSVDTKAITATYAGYVQWRPGRKMPFSKIRKGSFLLLKMTEDPAKHQWAHGKQDQHHQ